MKALLGGIVGVILLGGGAILRLEALSLASQAHETLRWIGWREQAIADIAVVLMAMGAAVAVIAFHHWLRRG